MAEVFISYRRQGALVHARAVFERLRSELGQKKVFMDLEGIEVGVDFVDLIEEQLRGCRVLLALIEPNWASATDRQGRRRLDLSNDYVRVEIATALRRGIRVMPILIDGAEMPEAESLPDDLKPLARLNAQLLDFQRFDAEIGRLAAAIRRVLASPAKEPPQGSADHGRPDGRPVSAPSDAPRPPPPSSPSMSPSPSPVGGTASSEPANKPVPPPSPSPNPEGQAGARRTHSAEPPAKALGRPWVWGSTALGLAASVGLWALNAKSPAPGPTLSPAVAAPAVVSEAAGPKSFRDCDVCPEMVAIPAGSFLMGSPADEPQRQADEGPQRRVSLKGFAMGKTEVTQGQWMALMGSNPSHFKTCGDDCPVEKVSWADAQEYIRRLNAKTGKPYTLPSEAQWEYAARAGTTTPFHTGQTITPAQANFDRNYTYNGSVKGEYRGKTVKAGSFAPNAFGLHDVHGNVWEWVQDCYDQQAYSGKAPSDGTALEAAGCDSRVLRGGSWGSGPGDLRAADRGGNLPRSRDNGLGFRVCRVSPI